MRLNFPKHYIQMVSLNFIAWAAYFVVYTFYAIFWRQYHQGGSYEYDAVSSLIWFFKEWGIWFVLSPILLWGFDHWYKKPYSVVRIIALGLASIVVAIVVRNLLNNGEYPEGAAIFIVMLPKYAPAFLVIVLGWYILGKGNKGKQIRSNARNHRESAPSVSGLQVEHQGLKLVVKPNEILFLKSAGNYVEIVTEESTYLKRSTLKTLISELPQGAFAQVHRSFAVNVNKLEKMTTCENGSATVTLPGQRKVPVSKRYKSKIRTLAISK